MGLSDPHNANYLKRVRRYAALYMNEDAGAPKLKLIRGMINGSRGPMLRKATALVEQMTGDSVTVTLVNISQSASREGVVQAGGYAEHQFDSVERLVNQPTTVFPRERN